MDKDKPVIIALSSLSALIAGFLIWWIYFKPAQTLAPSWSVQLPMLNAILNSLCALCLVFGRIAIAKGQKEKHIRLMISALFFSALFLFSYLTYHHYQGDTKFLGTGFIRPIYFFILITHIVLSIVMLPMILLTFWFAFKKQFEKHRKIAKLTFPIWLYVSVTGVAVFFFLKIFNP